MPSDGRGALDELQQAVRTKAELDVHFTLQSTLRTWLWVHIPPAIALLALVVAHIGLVLYH